MEMISQVTNALLGICFFHGDDAKEKAVPSVARCEQEEPGYQLAL